MPRPMKPVTQAIRKLLDQKGEDLTHADAAPLLAQIGEKEGFEVAENVGSEEFAKMVEYQIDWDDEASVQSVAQAAGLSTAAVNRAKKYRAWKLQENQFNVAKNSWKKEKAAGVSKRPRATRNVRATAAKAQQRKRTMKVVATDTPRRGRGRPKLTMPSVDDLDEIAALKYVESHGGLPAIEAQLVKAQAEVAYLTKVIELRGALRSRLDASEKAKAKAKTSAA